MSRPPANVKVPTGNLSKYASVKPLFTRPMPWWGTTIGSASLLLCVLTVTGTAVNTTWNYWTEATVVSKPANSPDGAERQEVQWTLRPTWQRAGLCFAHVMGGCMFAGGLLAKKALYIRSVYLVSPATTAGQRPVSDLRRLIIQSAADSNDKGYEFPVRGSWLEEGSSNAELVLHSNYANLKSRFVLPLHGSSVGGQQYSVDEARNRLISEWKNLLPPANTNSKR